MSTAAPAIDPATLAKVVRAATGSDVETADWRIESLKEPGDFVTGGVYRIAAFERPDARTDRPRRARGRNAIVAPRPPVTWVGTDGMRPRIAWHYRRPAGSGLC